MENVINAKRLLDLGLNQQESDRLVNLLRILLEKFSREEVWQQITQKKLEFNLSFSVYLFIFQFLFPTWPDELDAGAAWIPNASYLIRNHILQCMTELNIPTLSAFHQWSTDHFENFWDFIIKKLNIHFRKSYTHICNLKKGIEKPEWLVGAKLNIAESCFNAPLKKTAIIYLDENNTIKKQSYEALNLDSNRVANSLVKYGLIPGDAIAINLPMTYEAVVIYLGIIKMGGIVVSIADSFSPEEMATRLNSVHTKIIFTQDYLQRNNKTLPLYEKVIKASGSRAIVLSLGSRKCQLRDQDIHWQDFLCSNTTFSPEACDPATPCHILFSSGTTDQPKAIPWTHSTPIKSASDGYFHQNIDSDDILLWPTNLGWMMGPWIIFATLINQGTLALYTDIPTTRSFGEFIEKASVTILGVVPAIVAAWRQSQCMEGLNWQSIKLFTSTAECSNPIDMLYLMFLSGFKPIIEYCGGTETGGSYITSTLIEKNYPAVFSTPAMGLNFVIIDEAGHLTSNGEVALIPPSIGLSTELINANHHEIYYKNMPKSPLGKVLRRHGDQIKQLSKGMYAVLGRVDDTMNLSGIKISSAEIERVLVGIEYISETAAIAVNLKQYGPSALVIVAATAHLNLEKNKIKALMQKQINEHLNPLFKIHDVVFIKSLPKTASNKIMRRILRANYELKL